MAEELTPEENIPPPDETPDVLPVQTGALAHQETREEEARRALEHTQIGRFVAFGLTLYFVVTMLAPPAIQWWAWQSRHPAPRRGVAMDARPERYRDWPQALDILNWWPTLERIQEVQSTPDALALWPTVDEINQYEDNLKKESLLGEWLLPPMQWTLTSKLDAGNEQAYTGSTPGWLFYRPDVDYITTPGFLEPDWLAARRAADPDGTLQPNPLPAIIDFQRQLKARGVELLVMPVPAKPTIHPEMFSLLGEEDDAPNNPSYQEFIAALKQHDIAVFDPTEVLLERKSRTHEAQYLPADTHWTPQAMDMVAQRLTQRIQADYQLSSRAPAGYKRRAQLVTNLSDIAIMLKLPDWQQLYPRQTVRQWPVYDREGALWKPRRDSEILFLGDSFANIYSSGGYWGESAGLVEQVSYYLQRPVARIAVNGGGAAETRAQLASGMRAAYFQPNPDLGPLQDKKLVVYQFAARSLQDNDWKLIELPEW